MSDILYQRIKDNLEVLKMKSTLTTLDNYLERAVKDDLNIVEVLDHIFAEEAGQSQILCKLEKRGKTQVLVALG